MQRMDGRNMQRTDGRIEVVIYDPYYVDFKNVIYYYASLQCTELLWQFTSIDPNTNHKTICIETYECSGNGEKRNHKGF